MNRELDIKSAMLSRMLEQITVYRKYEVVAVPRTDIRAVGG